MRIALVYDCLFPNTVGGAERWYRTLAERLQGTHELAYLTRRQWGEEGPETPFETIAVSPGGDLYTASGRRRIGPPLRFGWGIFWHLLRHAHRYDAVHTASFPYFSVLGAALALRLRRSRARLVVDWHELWAAEYWRDYLGPVGGRIGLAVQSLCLRLSDHNFTFSRLVEGRLHAQRPGAATTRLTGEYAGVELDDIPAPEKPGASVVFAGRHIHEKRVTEIPATLAAARRKIAAADCTILGDGPETEALRARVRALGLEDAVEVRGRVDSEEVATTIAAAGCLLHPSEREGYGQVVVEALALGTPAIVVAGPENAAVELVEPGVNGFVAGSHDPEELGALVVGVLGAGEELRRSTREWYAAHREELSLGHSLEIVVATYASLLAAKSA
jgi:glycosyltransferase involved in cell wall biosynthesis